MQLLAVKSKQKQQLWTCYSFKEKLCFPVKCSCSTTVRVAAGRNIFTNYKQLWEKCKNSKSIILLVSLNCDNWKVFMGFPKSQGYYHKLSEMITPYSPCSCSLHLSICLVFSRGAEPAHFETKYFQRVWGEGRKGDRTGEPARFGTQINKRKLSFRLEVNRDVKKSICWSSIITVSSCEDRHRHVCLGRQLKSSQK